MASLNLPNTEVRESFLSAMAEFRPEGRGGAEDFTLIGWEFAEYGPLWETAPGFADYVNLLRAAALEESPRPKNWVPWTTMWWVDGAEYLGRIAIRHNLTPQLVNVGGHIGYDIRPTARRRGHATAMLAAALPVANALGIERALITCDADNVASRKVIEANGGDFEDRRGPKLRFWVPTGCDERSWLDGMLVVKRAVSRYHRHDSSNRTVRSRRSAAARSAGTDSPTSRA